MKRIFYPKDVYITTHASAVGGKERKGNLGDCFDYFDESDRFGGSTWEEAESEMCRKAFALTLKKAGYMPEDISLLFAGDLLNQTVGTIYGLMDFSLPHIGIFGACSTLTEGLLLSSLALGNKDIPRVAVVVSSHNLSAERQFRFPVEYGGIRTPTSQWTVTGAGGYIIEREGDGVKISSCLAGRIVDSGVTDANNMGAAMAPAAADSFLTYFAQSGTSPSDYDLILTGDLGQEGSELFCELCERGGKPMDGRHADCGLLIYNREKSDTHAGGSGCGCSGVVFGSYILPKLMSGEHRRVLFAATGALMNAATVQQGNSIPGIAHIVCLEGRV